LGKENVKMFERFPGVQPPPHPEEIGEALKIALRDADVRKQLVQRGIRPETVFANGLLFGEAQEGEPCSIHRCIRLSLSTVERSLTAGEDAFFPIVDLSAQRVDHIETLAIIE
jgi:hypothetical protein